MVAAWRARWGFEFPFLATQLGDQGFEAGHSGFPWPSYVNFPRDAQLALVPGRYPAGISRTRASGLVSAYDQGDREDNQFGVWSVHSRYKQEVARRMALVLAQATGLRPEADWRGPYPSASAALGADGRITIVWATASGGGLYVNDTRDCWECCDGARALDTFQVTWLRTDANQTNATSQTWSNTSFVVDAVAGTVVLTPVVPARPGRPYVVVRYAASLWPQCALYSTSNRVPAFSFSDLDIVPAAPDAAAASRRGPGAR